jgi:hypothetical protein
MTNQNPHPEYVYSKGMTYSEFLKCNPDADTSMGWDEDICEAMDVYYDLKRYYND